VLKFRNHQKYPIVAQSHKMPKNKAFLQINIHFSTSRMECVLLTTFQETASRSFPSPSKERAISSIDAQLSELIRHKLLLSWNLVSLPPYVTCTEMHMQNVKL
jgi:hypothetical protein